MKYIVISLLIFLFASVFAQNPVNEFDTKIYRKHFTEQQRIKIFKILSSLDSIVVSQNRFVEIDKAYQYYYDSICKLSNSSHEVYIANDGEVENFIFSLDTILFNKIWSNKVQRKPPGMSIFSAGVSLPNLRRKKHDTKRKECIDASTGKSVERV